MAKNTEKRTEQIIDPEYNPECALCPKLCSKSMSVCMEGDGKSTSDFLIVGASPTELDDELNRPFMDMDGEFLRDDLLTAAGIPESQVRFTYATRCHTPKNRLPSVVELRKCRTYLTAEINRIKPKVIVGMGDAALASLMEFYYKGSESAGEVKKGEAKVSGTHKWRGKLVWLNEFKCWLMPTFAAKTCLSKQNGRNPSYYTTDLVVDDLKQAWKALSKPVPTKFPKSVYITDPDKAQKILDKMLKHPEFAYDIETGGKGPTHQRRIIGASFACDEEVGYYIPWRILRKRKTLMHTFRKLVGSPTFLKIMHNGAFEERIHRLSETQTPWWDKYFDTMIAAALIDENFSKRLKDLVWLYTPIGGYDVELEKYKYENHIKEDYSLIPEEILGPYGGFDAVTTFILKKRFDEILLKEKMSSVFYKVAMPVRRVMCDAEYTGIHLDLDRAHEVDGLCTKARTILEDKIFDCAGETFNISSPKQLQNILFKKLKLKPTKKTKTGYSTDAESLKQMASQEGSEIVNHLLNRSYIKTMHGTHITQALNFVWEDGRVRTHYNSTGTVTGRISASRPSLQNVPADRLIRSIYSATPGNILIDADLKSAELAAIAAVSGETTFLEAFENGMDPHAATYRKMYGLPEDYIPTKLERRQAKTINFGLVYGLSVMGLAAALSMTIEEAQAFMDLYFLQLPHIYAWMEEQKRLVRERGYVVSVFGRKRRLPQGMSDDYFDVSRAERQAMNSPVQSSAADYTYIGLTRLSRSFKKEKVRTPIVHTVHDCVLTDTFPEEQETVTRLIKSAFETPVKVLPVKMRVDVETGTHWGEDNESKLYDILSGIGLKASF